MNTGTITPETKYAGPHVSVYVTAEDGYLNNGILVQKGNGFRAPITPQLLKDNHSGKISFDKRCNDEPADTVIAYFGHRFGVSMPDKYGKTNPFTAVPRCVFRYVSENHAKVILNTQRDWKIIPTDNRMIIDGGATVKDFDRDIKAALPDNPKILFFRDNGAGDVIMSIPTVREVKRRIPGSQINYAVMGYNRELLHGVGCIDVIRNLQGINFEREHFDLIVNWSAVIEEYTVKRNCGSRIMSFGKHLGLELTDTRTELHPQCKPLQCRARLIGGEKNLIGYVMQAATWNRSWPLWEVPKLCELFAKEMPDYKIVLIDADEDAGFEAPNVINTCGKTKSFITGAALAAGCDLVITQDTGITHGVVAMSDTPQLVLIGSMKPEWRFSHYKNVEWIQHTDIECCPCIDWQRHDDDWNIYSCDDTKQNVCLESITPAEIVEKAKGML